MSAAPNPKVMTIRNPRAQHRNASGREQAGTEILAMNQPATIPTHYVARKPISATNTRAGNPKSA